MGKLHRQTKVSIRTISNCVNHYEQSLTNKIVVKSHFSHKVATIPPIPKE